jgi:hypothetical protein
VCPGGSCHLANVAIDDIQLWCEAAFNVTDTSLCKSKSAPHTGCEQKATIKFPSLKGNIFFSFRDFVNDKGKCCFLSLSYLDK